MTQAIYSTMDYAGIQVRYSDSCHLKLHGHGFGQPDTNIPFHHVDFISPKDRTNSVLLKRRSSDAPDVSIGITFNPKYKIFEIVVGDCYNNYYGVLCTFRTLHKLTKIPPKFRARLYRRGYRINTKYFIKWANLYLPNAQDVPDNVYWRIHDYFNQKYRTHLDLPGINCTDKSPADVV